MIQGVNKKTLKIILTAIIINLLFISTYFCKNIKKNDFIKNENEVTKANIYLNFEQASLLGVVNYLAEQKKINLIPGNNTIKQKLASAKVTLSIRKPLTLEQAWDVLLTLLEINNFTIINVDNVYRIAIRPTRNKEPLPLYSSGTGTQPEDLPDSDLVVRYIYFLQNICVDNIHSLLRGMLEGIVQINKDLDALIITDKCINIKSAFKIIKELDMGGLRESIKMITLKHVDADYIEKIFNELIPKENKNKIRFIKSPVEGKAATIFSPDTKIIRYDPKNALILLGLEKNLNKILEFIFKYLDIPLTDAESMLHIKEIKYAKADNIKKILDKIATPPAGIPKTSQFKFFDDVAIVADLITEKEENSVKYAGGGNKLIVACNKEEWKRLEKLINKLDKPQPQVAFEVLIIDLTIKNTNNLKTQFKPKQQGLLGKGTEMIFNNLSTTPLNMDTFTIPKNSTAPPSTLTFGKYDVAAEKNNLWGVIQSYVTQDNSNLIAQPYMVVNNHKNCTLDFHSQRWVDGLLDKTVGTELAKKKTKVEAHKKVILTPHVNKEGLINLEIKLEVSSFKETESDSGTKLNRELTTRVTICTGEVLVLGGLTQKYLKEEDYKIPLLGDIPILGNIFRGKNKLNRKTNLYIFIRPSIIKPRPGGVPDEYTQLKLIYAKHEMIAADSYPREKDPIQRWFFQPTTQTIKKRVADAKSGRYRPLDNYATRFNQPQSADVKHDPYYRVSKAIKKEKEKRKLKQRKNNNK